MEYIDWSVGWSKNWNIDWSKDWNIDWSITGIMNWSDWSDWNIDSRVLNGVLTVKYCLEC